MTGNEARAGRREWIGLAVLVLPVLLISMDMTVLYFAVPFLSAALEPSATQQLWIVDVYAFLLAGLLITMGTLGDRVGRRLLLLVGAVAFSAASLAAAYAGDAAMLIAARAVMGVAGAVLAPSTLALIRNMFRDPGQRRTAIAVWTAGFSGGAAVGPIVSGLLLQKFWWGSVFLINLPVMAVLLVLGPILLPEYRDPKPGRFDLPGALLSLAAVLPMIYGMKKLATDGFSWPPTAILIAGVVAGALFVVRQRTARDPLIDLALFRNRGFSASILVNLFTLFAMVGFALFSTQWLQLVNGLSPLKAALWSLPAPVSVGVATSIAAALAKKVRAAYIIGGGLVIAAAGFAIMTQLKADSNLAVVVTGATVLAAGAGVALTLTADMIVSAAPPERAGTASALAETSNQLGGALGVAILGSIGTAIYTRDVAGSVTGLPPAARHAAKGTLGGAKEVAAHLPADQGRHLLDVAKDAFTHGMTINAWAGGALMLVGATAAVLFLRTVKPPAPPSAPESPKPETVSQS
ncbi:MFS transporter [Actinomadura rupiterrae]|uniref:MFS transporter n=1 Tax=Actinomadura rupiterrae TaxID=559627 RepID=UPI0020A5F904|nr:MFS transporter [Actinomadura rupiterrae]MCP2342718.1 DHA2 family multidrug resistance protein-like MFS transporter [Actinomadura rupiterrae]